ncbi:MAG: EboA domain-containing protein [Nannocystaceae bacterium]|nr:EboA domain-containing protein [Nannocystaceae bacterium]
MHGLPGAEGWLATALDTIDPDALSGVRVLLARCARKVGSAPLPVRDLEAEGWTARDAARAAIVLLVFERADPTSAEVAYGQWLRRGEQGEQESLLRMLPLLPEPERLVPHAVEACRTNSEVVFRAIACGNPFPAAYFPDDNFNQLVLKAVFMGVPVREIDALSGRVTAELVRMADDFAAERTAAGRPVPVDIGLLHQLLESR